MKHNNRPWQAVAPAALQWTATGEPHSIEFDDVYYSRDDGLAESRYVFLHGNNLPARWQAHQSDRFTIAETGFGTGLNFLLTWQSWLDLPEPRPALHYLSVEKHPLARPDLARALAAWPQLEPLTTALLEHYPGLLPGQHRLVFEQGQVTLDLWWEDVAVALPDLAGHGQPLVDAWYLDGFAPARNGAMWQPAMFTAIAALSRPDASFATFTAAGQVRRDLASAGFKVAKVAGHGRKRECLRGVLERSPPPETPAITPWDLDSRTTAEPGQVLVIGAGLAGCHTAAALARRGLQVTLLERGKLACAGSGNEQGILYTRLSRQHSSLTDFALQSFRFASAFYRDMFSTGLLTPQEDGELCGYFQQSTDFEEMDALGATLSDVQEWARILDPATASSLLGVEQTAGGYWFPSSGWLRPASVCRALAAHPGIRLLEDCGDISLHQVSAGWEARSNDRPIEVASCAIIATGVQTGFTRLEPGSMDWLPLQAIRGQTTQLPALAPFEALRAGLCHEGYIAPARAIGKTRSHCIGATFNLADIDPDLREADHRSNLSSLAKAVPAWAEALAALDPAALEGRVGFRCASPDYLPLVGPVPDLPEFLHSFAALRKNARQTLPVTGQYMPGLYLSTAHGSRGLSSTPLAAELLASRICAEPSPVSRELSRALAPARFIIRDLSRGRL